MELSRRLRNGLIQAGLIFCLVGFLGYQVWQGKRDVDREKRIYNESCRQTGIELSQVDEYQRIFDTNDDGVRDYAVQLRDGDIKIVHGYREGAQ